MSEKIELETPSGAARVLLHPATGEGGARTALVLGHGAGGGIDAPDLTAATEVAVEAGLVVALVEQPYRVAGRRAPPRAPHLDEAWLAVLAGLRSQELAGLRLVVGGRSLGARVACRTAAEAGAVAVLCLAFPLVPPRRSTPPPPSRLPELDALTIPALVVQGERDPFGIPPPGPLREVRIVPGDHSLRSGLDELRAAVGEWLDTLETR